MSKEMTLEEAKKIMAEAEAHSAVDKGDGLAVAAGGGPSFKKVAEATEVIKRAKLEAMTLQEAKALLEKFDPSKRMIDDDGKVRQAWKIMERVRGAEKEKLAAGDMRPNEVEALSQEEAYDTLRIHAHIERRRPLLKRLFAPKKPFYWESPLEWQDVKFESPKGQILFSHRIDLEYLTPDQEKQVREGLKKMNIRFEERNASQKDGIIRKGDRTLRISDAKSVEQLRSMVFHWASGKFAKPISMSIEDYYAIQNKMAEKRPALTPQKAPVPQQETTQAFDWQDPLCWHNVKFKEKGEVLFSHRLNLEKLTPEQEKEAKEGLEKHNIHFEERQATSDSGDIKQGDRTLRISDKESIEKLRTFVFHWAQGAGARPVSLSVEEYNAQEIQRQAALTGAQGGRK